MLIHLQPSPAGPARVVILGARGFVAAALAAQLSAEGIPVRAVGRSEVDLSSEAATTRLHQILRPDDAVVMTSAITPEKGRDAGTLLKNLQMAERLGCALSAAKCAHLIYLSSDAVYDWSQTIISETTPAAPTDFYSCMHAVRERILAQTAAAARLPCCILRPCAIYGPTDTHNAYGPNRFLRSAQSEGRIRIFGAGEETRDHVFIDDVISLIGLVLRHRSTGWLNVASGVSVTFAQVAALIQELLQKPILLEQETRKGPITHRRFDVSALQRSFPLHRPTTLMAGLGRFSTCIK
jgi:nucleoside-diphosphate-sugar epimerase